jgi:TIR domain
MTGVTREAKDASGSYFLSYSRSDERFALQLAKDLRARGIAMWIDQLDIRPSEHWDRAVERAVRSCHGLVVVLSPRSAESDNVADEISFAIDSGKSVLPVMIERCTMPLRITRMQVIDATGDYNRALERCVNELAKDDDPTPHVPEVPARMSAPIDAQALTTAKERLATIVGPIAGVLVNRAAARAGSVKELYATLAEHIESSSDRELFLGHASAPTQRKASASAASGPMTAATGKRDQTASIPSDELDRISQLMTRYIGPIATRVVKRESRAVASLPELRGHLAEMISDDEERAEFIRLAEGQ